MLSPTPTKLPDSLPEPSSDYLDAVFGSECLLANHLSGYESRDGQLSLAKTIDQGMREGRPVLAEGPCGTGKSLAYCVPAIYRAFHDNQRVVIATANIALQEQLITKDLPLLAKVLPWSFRFAMCKGRNNYLCTDRAAMSEYKGELHGSDMQIVTINTWRATTKTGDVSELPFVPRTDIWQRVALGSDECTREHCPSYATCFAERARTEAATAHIVVTNYHQLFAHLQIRRATGKDLVLPPFDLLICDEAHELANVARDVLGYSVSRHSVGRVGRYANDLGSPQLGDALRDHGDRFFEDLGDYVRSEDYEGRIKAPETIAPESLLAKLAEVRSLCHAQADNHTLPDSARAFATNGCRLADQLRTRIHQAWQLTDDNTVVWIETHARGAARLRAKVIDVSSALQKLLFRDVPSTSLVSATLTTEGSFDFIRGETGVPVNAIELVAPSPFDFLRQARLVVPDNLPQPNSPDFPVAVADILSQVIDACDGRTLGLFTSYRNLHAVADALPDSEHNILRQGDAPRTELVRLFTDDIHSVLLGTGSLWTGIDVPGQALTALVIDKIPFLPPNDPLVAAMCERDPQAFRHYLLPKAIMALRQGVGRLIRSRTDVGVIIITDCRLVEKSYGHRFLASLPTMYGTRSRHNLRELLTKIPSNCPEPPAV